MKRILLVFTFIFSFNSFSQNDLLGEWFLHYISVNGEIQSYQRMYYPYNLVFSETDFFGTLCNDYWSDYTYDQNNFTLTVIGLVQTLGSCAGSGGATEDYESGLFYEILSTNNGNPTTLDFETTGTGANETLTLTNLNGNYAVYGRQTLSLKSIDIQQQVSVYPNPVSSVLNIESKGEVIKYSIYNLNGSLISDFRANSVNKIDVSKLNSGIYFLKLMSENKQIQTLKFIKL